MAIGQSSPLTWGETCHSYNGYQCLRRPRLSSAQGGQATAHQTVGERISVLLQRGAIGVRESVCPRRQMIVLELLVMRYRTEIRETDHRILHTPNSATSAYTLMRVLGCRDGCVPKPSWTASKWETLSLALFELNLVRTFAHCPQMT